MYTINIAVAFVNTQAHTHTHVLNVFRWHFAHTLCLRCLAGRLSGGLAS